MIAACDHQIFCLLPFEDISVLELEAAPAAATTPVLTTEDEALSAVLELVESEDCEPEPGIPAVPVALNRLKLKLPLAESECC